MRVVACVLRSGGVFDPGWVYRLEASVRKWWPADVPYQFVCFTDREDIVEGRIMVMPLRFGWAGWWSKFEMYDPRLPWDFWYFDLDTLFANRLDDIARWDGIRPALLRDFMGARGGTTAGSGMMLWRRGQMRSVWEAFTADPAAVMAAHSRRSDTFLTSHLPASDRIQDLWPRQVVSSKVHARRGVPSGARVICMHGNPRVSDLPRDHHLRRLWDAALEEG